MKVAVTGGSGVVGRAVVSALVQRDDEVRALARSADGAEALASLGASPVRGSLQDRRSLEELVGGSDVVFNVAGVNELCSRDPDRMWKTNVEGPMAVLSACESGGVPRLIHTSSAVTIGEPKGTVGNEHTKHRGYFLSEYERSKTVSEQMLRSSTSPVDVVFVNPSSVQGPGRSTGTGRLLLAAARGGVRFAIDSVFSVVDIDDCAEAHLLAADRGVAGQRYLVSGSVTSTREVLRLMREISGSRRRTRFLKPEVARPLASALGAVADAIGSPIGVCAESLSVLTSGHSYDGSLATRELGLQYRSLAETLTRAYDWFSSEGLV